MKRPRRQFSDLAGGAAALPAMALRAIRKAEGRVCPPAKEDAKRFAFVVGAALTNLICNH